MMERRGLESAADRDRVLIELTMAGMNVFVETDEAGEPVRDETGTPKLRLVPYTIAKRK